MPELCAIARITGWPPTRFTATPVGRVPPAAANPSLVQAVPDAGSGFDQISPVFDENCPVARYTVLGVVDGSTATPNASNTWAGALRAIDAPPSVDDANAQSAGAT